MPDIETVTFRYAPAEGPRWVPIATGVGGPVGMMLVGAGANTIIQKATTGEVNWGEVALSGALGGFSGFGIAAKAGLTGFKAVVAAGATSGGVSGGVMNTYAYATGPGPHTPLGALGAAASGAGSGGLLGAAGGTAGTYGARWLMNLRTANPGASGVAIGRWMDGRVTPYAEANGLGCYRGTPGPIHKPLEHLWENAPEGSHLQSATKKVMDTIDENFNRAWINAQVNSGRNIVDIGVATDSTFY